MFSPRAEHLLYFTLCHTDKNFVFNFSTSSLPFVSIWARRGRSPSPHRFQTLPVNSYTQKTASIYNANPTNAADRGAFQLIAYIGTTPSLSPFLTPAFKAVISNQRLDGGSGKHKSRDLAFPPVTITFGERNWGCSIFSPVRAGGA